MMRLRMSAEHKVRALVLLSLAILECLLVVSCGNECKCSPTIGGGVAFPISGATDVPTNTKVWLQHCSYRTRLLEAGGAEVSHTLHCMNPTADFPTGVLEPHNDLRANTEYVIADYTGVSEYRFTTGDRRLVSPPPLPEVEELLIEHGTNCEGWYHLATYTLHGGERNIFLMDVAETTDFDPKTFTGSVSAISTDEIEIGSQPCTGADNFPGGASRRANTTVRFAALDLAGNFSGWTEPEELSLAGCNASGASTVPTWCLVPLLLRRRRKRPPTTDVHVEGR